MREKKEEEEEKKYKTVYQNTECFKKIDPNLKSLFLWNWGHLF